MECVPIAVVSYEFNLLIVHECGMLQICFCVPTSIIYIYGISDFSMYFVWSLENLE